MESCIQLNLPAGISAILSTLQSAGYEAYLAGGCVRDALLGQPSQDYDITTSARPEQVQVLFENTRPTGLQHGTVTVYMDGQQAEVTTYRKEGPYSDHRHPDQVHFGCSLSEDLARRDLTINAMAWSSQTGLIDLFGGYEDLKKGIIRAVGDPHKRFEEDALRMFRAFRFAARFGFSIEPATMAAIHEKEGLASHLAVERIRQEMDEILLTRPEMIEDMTGLLAPWIPELADMAVTDQKSPYHYTDVWHHTLDALKACTSPDLEVRWAVLLHDTGKPKMKTHKDGKDHFKGHEQESARIAARVMRQMKLPKRMARDIVWLVREHDTFYACRPGNLYKLCVKKGARNQLVEWMFQVQHADIQAHAIRDREPMLEAFKAYYRKARQELPLAISQLAINGQDVLERTSFRGPDIAWALDQVLQRAVCQPSCRTRQAQLDVLEKLKKD